MSWICFHGKYNNIKIIILCSTSQVLGCKCNREVQISLKCETLLAYPGFQRIFFLIDNEAALKQNYFFLLGALRLVNAASPRTISVHKKKISSGTQGTVSPDYILKLFTFTNIIPPCRQIFKFRNGYHVLDDKSQNDHPLDRA